MSFLDPLRQLLSGELSARLDNLETIIMSSLDTLQASVDRLGAGVATAVTALADQREKIAALEAAVNAGSLDRDRVAAIVASIDAEGDKIAAALAPVVSDPQVPTEEVAAPPQTNPDTTAPESVPDAVAAGEPLPGA